MEPSGFNGNTTGFRSKVTWGFAPESGKISQLPADASLQRFFVVDLLKLFRDSVKVFDPIVFF